MKKITLAVLALTLVACGKSAPEAAKTEAAFQVTADTLHLDSTVQVPITEEQQKVIDSTIAVVPEAHIDSLRAKAKAKVDSIKAAQDTTKK